MKSLLSAFFCLLLLGPAQSGAQRSIYQGLRTGQLFCEYTIKPLAIGTTMPHLHWTLESELRNQQQSACEIQVADNPALLAKDRPNYWNSGRISDSMVMGVNYAGKSLSSFTRYYWRVRVFDQSGRPSPWSAVSWFETAALSQSDWKASWIGDGSKLPEKEEDFYKPDPMPLFRKDFAIHKKLRSARLYISGLGYYEAFMNGEKIGSAVLDPGFTAYSKEVLYSVYDVASLLQKNSNSLAVMLGNGWWNPLPFGFFGRWQLRDFQQTGRPCLRAELHLEYKDGSQEVIHTDDSWLTRPGPIVRNNVYLGEYYDARLEVPNWKLTGRSADGWKQAVIAKGPEGNMFPQMQPPIVIADTIRAQRILSAGPDTFLVDMGQNFAGVGLIKVQGPKGTTISLRYGEDLFSDGRLNGLTSAATQIKKGGTKGGPGMPETAWQEDHYTLKGEGLEEWHPRFTFHGFRYIEVTGWPGKPALENFAGLKMHANLDAAGSFSCSNDMFNQLHEVIKRTFLSNVFSVQSDCPAREKMGYGGDMVATADAYMYNFDMDQFYRKAIRDFANDQRPSGGITEIAPFTGIASKGVGEKSGPLGWQLAFPFLQQQLYHFYGDQQVLKNFYPALKKQVDWLASLAAVKMFDEDISDHEALDPKPEAFSAAIFYLLHLKIAAEVAAVIKQEDDAARYTKLAARTQRNIVDRYLVPGSGRYDNGTQSAQALALWSGLWSEKQASLNWLISEINRHNGHPSTGIFATKMMLDILRESDCRELAYAMVNKRDFPGWGYMLANGATTLWETWAAPGTVYSMNHPMFGSVDEWFFRALLGINQARPGFKEMIIKPQPAGDLTWARGSYKSPYGIIESAWKIEGGTITMDLTIPAGTKATAYIPSREPGSLRESGQPVACLAEGSDYLQVKLGSGRYHFTAQYAPSQK